MIAGIKPGDYLASLCMAELKRKANQAWELAAYAHNERDANDAAIWTAKARAYDAEIAKRREGGAA